MAQKIETIQVSKPEGRNIEPYYTPTGVRADGSESKAFGGSLAYARKKAKAMLASGRFTRVYLRLSFVAGFIANGW